MEVVAARRYEELVNPRVTQTLLRQLSSTYTALRFLVISTLERFPSHLRQTSPTTLAPALASASRPLRIIRRAGLRRSCCARSVRLAVHG
jgi:hypothetical protein